MGKSNNKRYAIYRLEEYLVSEGNAKETMAYLNIDKSTLSKAFKWKPDYANIKGFRVYELKEGDCEDEQTS